MVSFLIFATIGIQHRQAKDFYHPEIPKPRGAAGSGSYMVNSHNDKQKQNNKTKPVT